MPETYGPVLLRNTAKRLGKETGQVYISVLEKDHAHVKPSDVFKRTLARPWVLLFREPIVLIASTYLAIIYGTIYMFLGAFSIVYQEQRGWDAGVGGLAFLGLAVGMGLGLIYTILDNVRYQKLGDHAAPESRLPPGMVGAIALPVGMFAFAWTNGAEVHWSASIILSAPFGFGSVGVFLSCMNYLMDSYTIYGTSLLKPSSRQWSCRSDSLCSRIGTSSRRNPSVILRCRVSPLCIADVRGAWYPLGQLDTGFPNCDVPAFPFHYAQIRRIHQDEVQICT